MRSARSRCCLWARSKRIAERLVDEVEWIRQCAEWLDHLNTRDYPPAVNIRPEADFPERANVVVDLPRVAAVLRRIAFDVDELARSVDDLQEARVADDSRAERRRRLAEPDLRYAEFCDRTGTPWRSTHHGEAAWTAYQAERRRRGETDEDPFTAYNPFRHGRHH
ncbi:hypothetical protein [Streptomyces syringium]|uniref:hypothetical protein n=1 Tax=Streptomyces syringium TaxID=76729 RepID=UPI0033ED4C4B